MHKNPKSQDDQTIMLLQLSFGPYALNIFLSNSKAVLLSNSKAETVSKRRWQDEDKDNDDDNDNVNNKYGNDKGNDKETTTKTATRQRADDDVDTPRRR